MKMNEWSMMKADFCFHSPRIAWLLANRENTNTNGRNTKWQRQHSLIHSVHHSTRRLHAMHFPIRFQFNCSYSLLLSFYALLAMCRRARQRVTKMECTRDSGENADRTPPENSPNRNVSSVTSQRAVFQRLIDFNQLPREKRPNSSFISHSRLVFATGCRCYTHQRSPFNSLALHLPPPHFISFWVIANRTPNMNL